MEIRTIKLYPYRSKTFRLLHYLEELVLDDFLRTDSGYLIELIITEEYKVEKFSNFYWGCLR